MDKPLHDCRPTAQEEQACLEAREHFADQLKQFPLSCEAVDRLERNLSVIALAVNIAASKPTGQFIKVDDGDRWHKDLDLLDNIYLCHRLMDGVLEYAVVEYFQMHNTNEIWNRGRNVMEVLKLFAGEQRYALQVWRRDMKVQLKEFLAEKYPDRDMSRVSDRLM